jgi:ring-1,2-phenylacetyl-CoA epoxidase subunit PaaC
MTMWQTIENAQQAEMNPAYRTALIAFLYQLADDDLVIGHRDSEWLGLAPEIEEDVAFSSISQDEVGHATFYYGLLESLGEGDADVLAFRRQAGQRRNALLVERENGDWARTIVRHYFYDVFEDIRLKAMADASYLPLRQGAAKIRREEFYHLMHLEMWFRRLAMAGGEAFDRMQTAINGLWSDLENLFDLDTSAQALSEYGILSMTSEDMKNAFMSRVRTLMSSLGLEAPETTADAQITGREVHTVLLTELLITMSEVCNTDLNAVW